jgi:glycosyltransferase involved in cell wall biosynthesis
MTWSVCIFAHNEERLLPSCLGALDAAAEGRPFEAHVMENGSADSTLGVARAIAAVDPRIRIHHSPRGDKSAAWNDYVYGVAPAADLHVFLDGDVRPCAGAFAALAQALEASPEAYAAAALPASGRERARWAERLLRESWISGNLYGVSGRALALIRQRNIRLPQGSVGEDGLLSYIFVTDFKGGPDDSRRERIAVAVDAHFEFDSLRPNLPDLRRYVRRLRRYSFRHFQNEILYARLKREGLAALPVRIGDIFTPEALACLRPRLDPETFFVDLATLANLRSGRQFLPG